MDRRPKAANGPIQYSLFGPACDFQVCLPYMSAEFSRSRVGIAPSRRSGAPSAPTWPAHYGTVCCRQRERSNGTLQMAYGAGFLAFATMATKGIGREVFDWYASYRLLLVWFMSSQSRG